MTVKEFLTAYCGKSVVLSLWDYTTEEELKFNLHDFAVDDNTECADWKNAEVRDWEIVDGTMNLNVIREE